MDRRSFINQDLLNNSTTGKTCPLDDCECSITQVKEKQGSKKTGSFHFAAIIMMAFVCATALSFVRIQAAKKNVTGFILEKKEKIISCAPSYTNKKKLNDNHEPANRNNQNSCSHQQGYLCESNSSKRKSLKTHNC